MAWLSLVNVCLSIIAGGLIAYELFKYPEYLTHIERLGKGIMGSALILTIAPIWANAGAPYLSRAGTPYNVWPSTLLRTGIIIFIVGRIIRHYRHERANRLAVQQAEAHFAAKGVTRG